MKNVNEVVNSIYDYAEKVETIERKIITVKIALKMANRAMASLMEELD